MGRTLDDYAVVNWMELALWAQGQLDKYDLATLQGCKAFDKDLTQHAFDTGMSFKVGQRAALKCKLLALLHHNLGVYADHGDAAPNHPFWNMNAEDWKKRHEILWEIRQAEEDSAEPE